MEIARIISLYSLLVPTIKGFTVIVVYGGHTIEVLAVRFFMGMGGAADSGLEEGD